MRNQREAFLEALGEVLDAEIQMEQVLKQRFAEVGDKEIKDTFWQHSRETNQQVHNLRRCFALLGLPPERHPCLAIEHWKQGHDAFLQNRAWPTLMITMFDLSEARRIARYEVASYQGLIRQARALGEQTCITLLQQNLSQEEQMLQKALHFSRALAPQLRPE